MAENKRKDSFLIARKHDFSPHPIPFSRTLDLLLIARGQADSNTLASIFPIRAVLRAKLPPFAMHCELLTVDCFLIEFLWEIRN